MSYLYRFINKENEIIYIGKTLDIDRRINKEHFTSRGHLPLNCYYETNKIEYTKALNKTEMDIYEIYYIKKFRPKFNTQYMCDDELSFVLNELDWNLYKVILPSNTENNLPKRNLYNRLLVDREDIFKVFKDFITVDDEIREVAKDIHVALQREMIPLWCGYSDTVPKDKFAAIYEYIDRRLNSLKETSYKFLEAQ